MDSRDLDCFLNFVKQRCRLHATNSARSFKLFENGRCIAHLRKKVSNDHIRVRDPIVHEGRMDPEAARLFARVLLSRVGKTVQDSRDQCCPKNCVAQLFKHDFFARLRSDFYDGGEPSPTPDPTTHLTVQTAHAGAAVDSGCDTAAQALLEIVTRFNSKLHVVLNESAVASLSR